MLLSYSVVLYSVLTLCLSGASARMTGSKKTSVLLHTVDQTSVTDPLITEFDGVAVTGVLGPAMTTNAVNGWEGTANLNSYADFDEIDLDGISSFTVTSWMYRRDGQKAGWFSYGSYKPKATECGFMCQVPKANGIFCAVEKDGQLVAAAAPQFNGISSGQWHHLAVVKNETDITFYVDGGSKGTLQDITSNSFSCPNKLKIGAWVNMDYARDHLNGWLKEVRVFSFAADLAFINNVKDGVEVLPVDCVGAFGSFGSCDVTCGSGTQIQTYVITTPATGAGAACTEANDGDTRSQACDEDVCPAEPLEVKAIRFPDADFQACCDTAPKLTDFLLECSTIYAPLECVNATSGSVIVEFQGTSVQINDALAEEFPFNVTSNGYTVPFTNWEEYTAGASGDPHFRGFDGSQYDFQGSPGAVYNIITAMRFQLNARFVESPTDGKTYMGVVGLRVGSNKILVTSDIVLVNDVGVAKGDRVHLNEEEGTQHEGLLIFEAGRVRVKTETFDVDIEFAEQDGFVYLNIDAGAVSSHLVHPHGILGQTAQYMVDGSEPHPVRLGHKNRNAQGFLAGVSDDYIVADGLLGTKFAFNRFGKVASTPQSQTLRRFAFGRAVY